jgi:type II secretory pathway pseudopilin PulG
MIELLVVIGIIVVLIGLLVPVISRVRTSAATANVTNQMHRIAAAIGNYYSDFNAYPGALPNSAFAPPGPAAFFTDPTLTTYTQSEDLVMALRGGLRWNTAASTLDLIPQELDLGPVSFNRAAVSPRKNAYVANIPAEFPPPNQAISASTNELPGLSSYVKDSKAPEFMDIYSDPRPILYVRAGGSPGSGVSNIVYNSKGGSFNSTKSYDLAAIQPYLQSALPNDDFHDPADKTKSASKTGFTSGNLDPTKSWIIDYFTAPGGTSARGGGYLLLDAGADRIFGTEDDIIVGAGGGQ